MTKVKNRAVIRRLALRELLSNRRMSAVVIISIMLTCVLFTALTSIGGSLINGAQRETMRQVGGDRMAGLKCVLSEDLDKVIADEAPLDVVYRIMVGVAVNDGMKISAEFNCAGSDDAARALFSYPETGRLPENTDEIAVSTAVLDDLDIPHELGAAVPIKLDIDGKVTEHTFTLCGFWEGDKVAMAQICWVSKEFADRYAPTPTESFYTQEHSSYAGYYMVDFNYANSFDIEGKTEALLERLYGSGNRPNVGINWAYTTSSVDGGSLAVACVMMLVIFAAGYLIIYNIFHINISANIRSYGLLKTIGTTSRQLGRMVRIQAAVYCALGIPFGLVIGVMTGKILLKSVVKILNVYSAESYSVGAKMMIVICAISALFTFATVMISCIKPCRTAGNVSPIEALRYNDTSVPTKKKEKKTAKVTPLTIAHSNMRRSRKKTIIVVMSLTLSFVLVNTLFTALNGIDKDKYVSNSIIGDIIIRHTDKTDLWNDITKGVTPEMIDDIRNIDGAQVHPVYYESARIIPGSDQLDSLKALRDKYNSEEIVTINLDEALKGSYIADIYGIDETTAGYLEPLEGVIDAKKVASGKYAVVHTYLWLADDDPEVEIYHPGDTISVECDGENREYEVMAVCNMPYPLSTKIYNILSTQVIIPAEEYMSLTKDAGAACVMVNTDDSSGRVKAECRVYCDQNGSPLIYTDKQTYLDEFSDFLRMIKLLGGTLTGILALIGVINFVNAVTTSIISRKRELAMMNAVGMTSKQTVQMLMWEGIHYAVFTAVCSVLIGTMLSLLLANSVAKELFFFTYHFTLLPIAVCVPILIVFSVIVPFAVYSTVCKDTIVERLRTIE